MQYLFKDRIHAGKLLSQLVYDLKIKDPLILAVPRGGIIVGNEIANKLGCHLDVIISKKITPPDSPEYAIGAILEDGTIFKGDLWNKFSSLPNFDKEIEFKKAEINRRIKFYGGTKKYSLEGKSIILVDDGIATGHTIFPIINWLKSKNVKQIILAVPVIPYDTFKKLREMALIITIITPTDFSAVGQFYENFDQVSDDEASKILKKYLS